MKLLLTRHSHEDKQTLGRLYLLDINNNILGDWHALELPWKNNQRRVSCIPIGTYKARKHRSPKFGNTLWIPEVPNRSEILIHPANKATQLLGCIAPGTDLRDINNDGYLDVINSKVAMREILANLKKVDSIMIEIVNSN